MSGLPLHRYFRERIFEPLVMSHSDLLRSEQTKARLATRYEIHCKGVKQVAERDMVTTGAVSIYSISRGMARYLAALLRGGSNQFRTVLKGDL